MAEQLKWSVMKTSDKRQSLLVGQKDGEKYPRISLQMETEQAKHLALAGNNFIQAVKLINAIESVKFDVALAPEISANDVDGKGWFDSRLELNQKLWQA